MMSSRCASVVVFAGVVLSGWGAPAVRAGESARADQKTAPKRTMPPQTPQRPVTNVYHGTTVTDDYRWLEDWDDPEVKKWSDAQNAYTRGILDHLPHVAEIRARVKEILSAKTVSYSSLEYRSGKLFAIQREPPKEQPFLIVMSSPDAPQEARVLVDPNKIDSAGATSIDWYMPSPDGRLVAVSLSQAGSEAGDVHLFETATGKKVHEVIPRVNTGTAGGDLAWLPDATGFFYTRHPRPGEQPPSDLDFFQQIYFHELGTPTENDRYELGKEFPRVAEIQFAMHDPSGTLLASVQDGDGGEFAHFLRSPKRKWVRLADFKGRIKQVTFGMSGDLFLISREGAPRGKIIRVALSKLDLPNADSSDFDVSNAVAGAAQTIVPEGNDTVVTSFNHASPSLLVTHDRLYVIYQTGGPSELRVFNLEGKPLVGPEQLPLSSVGGLTRFEDGDVLFSTTSYVEPPAFHRFSAESGTTGKAVLATTSPLNFRDVEIIREFAMSKDGTKVPVNILIPKTARRDGPNPALLTGYGGYGVSLSPSYSAVRHVLMEQGMIWAVGNLRGGGEYGEPWHLQGNLTNKQNVFDDFAAVLRHTIDRGYTSAKKLAIEGGSNGGLLMGATFTQHPELVKTVVSHVGIYDMLRVELSPNGAFNIAEFGTVKDLDQFRALWAYSPYHHVEVDVPYPSVLFLTGANDPRVDPMQSRKMTAKLQSVVPAAVPILLRTSSNSGHGAGTALSERIEQTVDVFAFIFDQLGVEYQKKR